VSATDIDPRLALLQHAAAKLALIEESLEDLDRAFDDIVHAVHVVEPCTCERQILDALEEHDRRRRR
jgi:hypothetical protein